MSDSNSVHPSVVPGNQALVLPDQVLPSALFVLATPGPVLFPTLVAPFIVWNPRAIASIEEALKHGKYLGLLLSKPDTVPENPKFSDLYSFGVVIKILKKINLPDGSIHVLVQGIKRFAVSKELSEQPQLIAEPQYFEEKVPDKTVEFDALTRNIINHVKSLSDTNPFFTEEMKIALLNAPHSGVVADIVAFALALPKDQAQKFLETLDIQERYNLLLGYLKREQDVANIQKRINDDVNTKLTTLQREFFLKEQLKTIKKELGLEEDGKEKNSRSFKEKIESVGMSEEAKKIALAELEKFETLNEASPEYSISRNYLETLTSLPWNIRTTDQLQLAQASQVLNQDHFGMEKVKERILEFIAVRNLAQRTQTQPHKGSILLLVGPPGVGKTSVGKSIARALNRKFYRFSLGGLRDEAEIKGHRRTYIGAMPGKFIESIKRAGSKNPVILLDEIDKMATHYTGDPASALLEVLDPEQNQSFLDHYLDTPFDLSETIFVCTANSTQTIPTPLLDRMEVIELSGYTSEEKEQIAKKYLLPRVLAKASLKKDQVKIDKKVIQKIIQKYTREPGLRLLEQKLEQISRKVAAKIVDRYESRERLKLPVEIKDDDLVSLLGAPRFSQEEQITFDKPGMMIGLAWTPLGGEILHIETSEIPGTGQLKLTGQMGEVMNESAQIAWSFIKKYLFEKKILTPTQVKEMDIHIHIPAGAIPKDGPSAGITLASALYSLFTKKPATPKLAMTGELSLTGRVLPIGGLKEKLLAAKRAGIQKIVLPCENKKDISELPAELLSSLSLHYVEHLDEVLALVVRDTYLPLSAKVMKKKKSSVKKIALRRNSHKKNKKSRAFIR